MDYRKFYAELFAPLETELGPIDPLGIFHIFGFEGGGPLNFSTIGAEKGGPVVTYISCELAACEEQIPSDWGRYELLCSCDEQDWVRSVLSELGRMSFNVEFGHDHTVDIGPIVEPDAPIQGVLFQCETDVEIDGVNYAVFRVIGITRAEMQFKVERGTEALIELLKANGIYPHTFVHRKSIDLSR